jgi:hypothetical protein
LERSDLSHRGWTNASHNWFADSFSRAWLHEGQDNSNNNCEDDQEDIKGGLTLTTPTNCKENSKEDTQGSQKSFQVNVHLLYSNIILNFN